jgi:GNAT superfamily N-acetyltransferase
LNIFTSVDKIERLELELTIFNSKRALSSMEKDLETFYIGNSVLLRDVTSPESIYYNRIKGFGASDLDKLNHILTIFEQGKITPCFDMTPLGLNYDVAKALTSKGFFSAEQLAFLQISADSNTQNDKHIKIISVTEDHAEQFIKLIGQSNDIEYRDSLIKRKSEYFHRPNFKNYIAFSDDHPAGIGSLFISGNDGYIANDFTFPAFRGKGIQKALIHHRLQAAKELGLENIYTDVEFGSISHNNMAKMGFQLVYVNSFWMKQ